MPCFWFDCLSLGGSSAQPACAGWAPVIWRVNIRDFVTCSRDKKNITKIHSSPKQTQPQTLKIIPKLEKRSHFTLTLDAFEIRVKM